MNKIKIKKIFKINLIYKNKKYKLLFKIIEEII